MESDAAQVQRFRDEVAERHDTDKIHLLFNNAGIGGAAHPVPCASKATGGTKRRKPPRRARSEDKAEAVAEVAETVFEEVI